MFYTCIEDVALIFHSYYEGNVHSNKPGIHPTIQPHKRGQNFYGNVNICPFSLDSWRCSKQFAILNNSSAEQIDSWHSLTQKIPA